MRGVVEISERRSSADVSEPPLRVDAHIANPPEVDDESVVHRSEARDAVPPSTHCDVDPRLPTPLERSDDVARVRAAND